MYIAFKLSDFTSQEINTPCAWKTKGKLRLWK